VGKGVAGRTTVCSCVSWKVVSMTHQDGSTAAPGKDAVTRSTRSQSRRIALALSASVGGTTAAGLMPPGPAPPPLQPC
jgi:hypothetical protein